MIIKKVIVLIIFSILTLGVQAKSKEVWVTINHTVIKEVIAKKHRLFNFSEVIKGQKENHYLTTIDESDKFAAHLHHILKRCGGFTVSNTKPKASIINKSMEEEENFWPNELDKLIDLKYNISRTDLVNDYFLEVNSFHVDSVINQLTSFHTRYYRSPEGIAALKWIGNKWLDLVKIRSDAKVEFFKHENHDQPSVILTIEGSDPVKKDQIIIIGGHGDSINSDDPTAHLRSPGANDNAAGIAVITDIIKILVEKGYRPSRTIQFIAYAAEEVGLQGSMEIASHYLESKKKVVGVLQLDGINYVGKTFDLALISDLTHKAQNQFLAKLVDTYLKAKWSWDKCDYACSDHYSWHLKGYRASFPVEGIMSEQNPFIHTSDDTFDKSNNNSDHALMFEKLALAYLLELDQ